MVLVSTPEEELASRKADYEKLTPGNFFNLGTRRYFIAVEKLGDCIEVVELNAENLRRIVCSEPCVRSILHFDDMFCLNVRD
jgi:hypothetical protein